ncbi:hypothetical protein L1887_39211 [Cichorium endivia]|nr:hypothetical protein L1887_39211 [Cichorium endivia]
MAEEKERRRHKKKDFEIAFEHYSMAQPCFHASFEEYRYTTFPPPAGATCVVKRLLSPVVYFRYIFIRRKILEVLKNWPERSIQVIVVTDGERIFGLGDLRCRCLPITIDVETNNPKLLDDEFYIGLKQKRTAGKEYYDLLEEFMSAVKQNYAEKVLEQVYARPFDLCQYMYLKVKYMWFYLNVQDLLTFGGFTSLNYAWP